MTTNSNNSSGIRVESKNSISRVNASSDAFIYYTNLSKDWANKTIGTVDGEEYSAKYYSQQAYQTLQNTNNVYQNTQNYITEIQTSFRQGTGLVKVDENNAIKTSADGIYVDLSDIESDISNLNTDVGSIETNIGDLTNLTTDVKTNVVLAINEHEALINQKVNTDFSNAPTSRGFLESSYVNGTSWYRVYSDKWCEQGGFIPSANGAYTKEITLLKPYANSNYTITTGTTMSAGSSYVCTIVRYPSSTVTSAGFKVYIPNGTYACYWCACGYIA